MGKQIVLQGGTPGYKLENVRDTYFIGAYEGKKLVAVKIGVCARGTAKTRLSVLQVGSLLSLKLLAVYSGNVERKLHRLFAKFHLRGEFFKPTPELLQLVGRLRIVSNDLAKLESESEPQDAVAMRGFVNNFTVFSCVYNGTIGGRDNGSDNVNLCLLPWCPNPICLISGTVNGRNVFPRLLCDDILGAYAADECKALILSYQMFAQYVPYGPSSESFSEFI